MAAPDFPQPVWSGLRDQSSDWILLGSMDRAEHRRPLRPQPAVHRGVHGRTQPRDVARAPVERVPDRSARHLLPAVLGRARERRRVGEPGEHRSHPHLAEQCQPRYELPGHRQSERDDCPAGARRRHPPLSERARLRLSGQHDDERARARHGGVPAVYRPPRHRHLLLRVPAADINVARGNPGRYFVLQEQPSEPRFDPTTTPGQLPGGSYVTVDPNATPLASAASFAIDHYQPPTRVAIHASTLTPPQ